MYSVHHYQMHCLDVHVLILNDDPWVKFTLFFIYFKQITYLSYFLIFCYLIDVWPPRISSLHTHSSLSHISLHISPPYLIIIGVKHSCKVFKIFPASTTSTPYMTHSVIILQMIYSYPTWDKIYSSSKDWISFFYYYTYQQKLCNIYIFNYISVLKVSYLDQINID